MANVDPGCFFHLSLSNGSGSCCRCTRKMATAATYFIILRRAESATQAIFLLYIHNYSIFIAWKPERATHSTNKNQGIQTAIVRTDFHWSEILGSGSGNHMPASVNTSRLPKKNRIGRYLVWVPYEFQRPMKSS
jgi:hypothetical protein